MIARRQHFQRVCDLAERVQRRVQAQDTGTGTRGRVSARFVADIAQAIVRCARWHACPRVLVTRTVPGEFAPQLVAALSRWATLLSKWHEIRLRLGMYRPTAACLIYIFVPKVRAARTTIFWSRPVAT